mmetsp:Transcript_4522/g.12780  ORF Transcript_4522/g.12780 Transcript_4522/m.12780 type:complete len:252 (-) Transcript_4522:1210-1965(-)
MGATLRPHTWRLPPSHRAEARGADNASLAAAAGRRKRRHRTIAHKSPKRGLLVDLHGLEIGCVILCIAARRRTGGAGAGAAGSAGVCRRRPQLEQLGQRTSFAADPVCSGQLLSQPLEAGVGAGGAEVGPGLEGVLHGGRDVHLIAAVVDHDVQGHRQARRATAAARDGDGLAADLELPGVEADEALEELADRLPGALGRPRPDRGRLARGRRLGPALLVRDQRRGKLEVRQGGQHRASVVGTGLEVEDRH